MKIEIWSDIRCPFCYIGKRKFEQALERFPHKDKVEVTWKSFQLDPGLKTQPGMHVYDYLAQVKGISREQTLQMHDHVRDIASRVGLDFNFDHAVVANSFNAHRVIQFAKQHGLGAEAEEHFFRAHFTEGKNIDDPTTLLSIGAGIGLPDDEVRRVVEDTSLFADKVREDEAFARAIGIRGVPFFLFNQKFAVSGAQDSKVFLQALNRAWHDHTQVTAV